MNDMVISTIKKEWVEGEEYPFKKTKVGETIFSGYDSHFFQGLGPWIKDHQSVVEDMGIITPPYVFDGKFSFLYGVC